MNVFKATLDTRHQNGVIGTITQFDNAVLELQIVADGQVGDAWESPQFELIAMKRDLNPVCEVYQDRFTILNKEEHKVQIELKEQFLTCRGTVKMQLVVKDGSRLSTTLFYLIIGQSLDHDIVESHRDVKVLDDLEAYVKQGFDDLAFQEQRMAAVEQSTNDLNDTMNANEAERNKSEITRQKTFDINEENRARTFNNQVEKQGVAFSNAQTQREKDFSESQQNMSQVFETSQRERESAFNKAQEFNQTTFTNNETKRQTAFNQSQTANQQDFVDNEAERQRLFEVNESSRQKSESQRVKNESERVFAETQRADAEVIRQQKMTEFEEKATQLSEDLDSQVARVGEFVSANEEKLLGPHDKTDYMGNAHKSVKDANDANIEYILGEVNTVHYEGQHITATDTIEKQVRSAILKGNTLVNLVNYKGFFDGREINSDNTFKIDATKPFQELIIGKEYTFIAYVSQTAVGNMSVVAIEFNEKDTGIKKALCIISNPINGVNKVKFTVPSNYGSYLHSYIKTSSVGGSVTVKGMIIEGDHTNEDIPYFEGMQSVRMPVLTTVGKNLFNYLSYQEKKDYTKYEPEKIIINSPTQFLPTQYDLFLEEGKTYVISCEKTSGAEISVRRSDGSSLLYDTTSTNCKKVFVAENNTFLRLSNREIINEDVWFSNIQIEEGSTATPYEPFKSNILSIDGEYRGIGDVCDTVDCMTGEVVERIGEIVLDENITGSNGIIQGTLRRFDITLNKSITEKIISDKFRTGKWNYNLTINTAYEFIGYYNPTTLLLAVESSKLPTQDLSGLKEYLQSNPITVQYELAEPVIKTVDLNGQKVYSYDGTTHYSCSAAEGSLIPTLAIDVPTNLPALVSRQRVTIESQKEQIITLEQENEQLIAQNEVQDIDISLNQDAINFMLFAPATMSLNDESRNNEGVNAMAAYLANQILKGKLDYSLVVSRYGTYKEDIDTILIAEGKQDLIK